MRLERLLIATTNPHKLREIRALLAGVAVELSDLTAIPPVPEPDETGSTFMENARLKAVYYSRRASAHRDRGCEPSLVVAEDSGLVVDALGGEPGVRSARFLRPDATYSERFAEIYRRLSHTPADSRSARFVCALVAAREGQIVFETTGIIEGAIAPAPHGAGGFGYDPIFYYPPYGATLAEASEEAKLRVAHRGQAFRALAHWLATRRRQPNHEA